MNPTLVRRVLLPAHERLLGRRTLAYLNELERSQWWSADDLRKFQLAKLRDLLEHAHAYCPFYRERIARAQIPPTTATIADLKRLPVLTKEDIRNNLDGMCETPRQRRLFRYTTGGSSGDPLIFRIDRARQAADQAARARSRRWFDIDLGERELFLWGAAVELRTQDRLKHVRDRLTNQLLLSAFDMTPAKMTAYFEAIAKFDPVHIFGYPSSLARLVRHGIEMGVPLRTPSLTAVFTTGEVLLAQDRALIQEFTGVPVADGYGSREAGFIAHACPEGRYHVTMESLIVELLDEQGRDVTPGESGDVTVTHLDAFGMPFIRYRTGDRAVRSANPCPCGRGLETLDRIEGRRTDMLRTADGGYAHALAVIYVVREQQGVREFRVEQGEDLSLCVKIVTDATFQPEKVTAIERGMKARIGNVPVRVQLVDQIPVEASGKHRCVISRAP